MTYWPLNLSQIELAGNMKFEAGMEESEPYDRPECPPESVSGATTDIQV